jgi:CRP-like cAMP-binding protein
LQLPKAQLDRIVTDEPRYFPDFAQLVFERYATLARILVEVQGVAPEARLRSRLATMVQLQLQDRPQSAPAVSLAVSQADLARIVGVSRQTLNALLGKLDREGLIEVGFRRIRVLEHSRLAGRREEIESREMPRSAALTRGAPSAGASSERFE